MKTYAAICADPSGLNPGMLSVDLALDSVFRSLPGHNGLFYLNPKKPRWVNGSNSSLNYLLLNSQDELEKYDCVIYWGDFFHWLPFARWDWPFENPMLEDGKPLKEMVDRWYSLFLLENCPEKSRKHIVVFGGTFYGLTARHLSDNRYLAALSDLYRAARLVAPRDIVSASLVPQLAPNHAYALGCDCALLLDADSTLPMDKAQEFVANTVPREFVVCFFGRSGVDEALHNFAQKVAIRMQLPLVVLDWLGSPEGLDGLAFKLAVLRASTVVITDTYHLAVSAWREGVVAIGIGRAQAHAKGTLDDKKKEIFFRQILASDYYLFAEEIVDGLGNPLALENLLENTVMSILDTVAISQVRKILAEQVSNARHKLIDALIVEVT